MRHRPYFPCGSKVFNFSNTLAADLSRADNTLQPEEYRVYERARAALDDVDAMLNHAQAAGHADEESNLASQVD